MSDRKDLVGCAHYADSNRATLLVMRIVLLIEDHLAIDNVHNNVTRGLGAELKGEPDQS